MADEEPPAGREQRLLVADSDVLVRHAIADYLRRCGYTVIEAASYEEARAVLGSSHMTPDLVLSDVELSGDGNGFALRSLAAREWPDVEVILAGNVETAARAAGDLCERGPQLARPHDPQLVLERIRRALATRLRR